MSRQVFGGRVGAVEVRDLVEISIVAGLEKRLQRLVSAANIDDDPVGVESVGKESCVNHKGCAVERLGRAENASTKRMGDHDMVANFNGEQCDTSSGRRFRARDRRRFGKARRFLEQGYAGAGSVARENGLLETRALQVANH